MREGDGTDNRSLAELLSCEAGRADGHLRRAYRRAARAAFLWPVEARDLHAAGRPLDELRAIGPYLARVLRGWIESPAPPPEPPRIRSGFLTMAHARTVLARHAGRRVRGDLQVHTTWSDGCAEPLEMADAARALGREYVGITDHSHGLKIAGGMSVEELREQGRHLERLNAASRDGFVLLRAVEANLDPSGGLDLGPEDVAGLDLVLGAFHSALRRKEDQTERYLAALRHPSIDVLAHPRTRVYDHRQGLDADWPRVFAEAARQGKAVEIDAYPDRQDLEVGLVEGARAAGCHVSIGSDAHRPDELQALELGLAAAVLGGIPDHLLLNAWSADEIRTWSAERRARDPVP